MEEVIIVGGGIGGLALAAALHKQGKEVRVLEAAPKLEPIGAGILLAHNAQAALAHLGVLEEIAPRGHALEQGRGYAHTGKALSTYGVAEGRRPWLSIHRGQLQQGLLAQANQERVTLHAAVTAVNMADNGVELLTQAGDQFTAQRVIAFDGIHSAVRQAVAPTIATRYAGYTCWRGVARGYRVPNPTEFSESTGRGTRFGIVPLGKEETYWFACANAPRKSARHGAMGAADLLHEYFGDFHAPVPALLQHTDQVYWGDIEDIPPPEKLHYGSVILAGDAGHATTPNLGQGAGMALEDAAVLFSLLQKDIAWEEVGRQFEALRLARTQWVTKNSWQFGKVAQWQNPVAVSLRNLITRATPSRVIEKQMRKLAQVQFEA